MSQASAVMVILGLLYQLAGSEDAQRETAQTRRKKWNEYYQSQAASYEIHPPRGFGCILRFVRRHHTVY
jgi:hypothetical protein